MALTAKQKAFVEAYDGNGTAAARAAGYKGSDNVLAQQARANLRNPQILAAIEARTKGASEKRIATREERQAFWTQVLRGEVKALDPDTGMELPPRMADRLKAAELLGKSEGDFIERHQHEVGATLEQLVAESLKPRGDG